MNQPHFHAPVSMSYRASALRSRAGRANLCVLLAVVAAFCASGCGLSAGDSSDHVATTAKRAASRAVDAGGTSGREAGRPAQSDRAVPQQTPETPPDRQTAAAASEAQLSGPASNPPLQQTGPRSDAPAVFAKSEPQKPQKVYRPSGLRPKHDDAKLASLGIAAYESKRLKLYTDVDPDIARTLPAIMDQAYEAWEEYFGELPPNREGTDYQMTGYIMVDKDRFRQTGLLPDDLPGFLHGRHRGAEFWMNDQRWDYYRRHLMIHEGTHCFMMTMPGVSAPVWYLEGMAELFGTHRVAADGTVHFRIMPHDESEFSGFGRIELMHREVEATRYKTLREVFSLPADAFLKSEPYAWSWALCKFFDAHPRYRHRFRELGQHTQGSQFAKAFWERFERDGPDITTEWPLFASNLEYGYDAERSTIAFETGQPLADGAVRDRIAVRADRGWQSSGVLIEQGRTYEARAGGWFTLAQRPKPWVSDPNGISIRYYRGKPLGQLLACIRSDPPAGDTGAEPMLTTIAIGPHASFVAPMTGTLYFRVNEFWSELADNTGTVTVEIHALGVRR